MDDDINQQLASGDNAEIVWSLSAIRGSIDKILERIEEKFTEIPWRTRLH